MPQSQVTPTISTTDLTIDYPVSLNGQPFEIIILSDTPDAFDSAIWELKFSNNGTQPQVGTFTAGQTAGKVLWNPPTPLVPGQQFQIKLYYELVSTPGILSNELDFVFTVSDPNSSNAPDPLPDPADLLPIVLDPDSGEWFATRQVGGSTTSNGLKGYAHVQTTASNVWQITHNMGTENISPSVYINNQLVVPQNLNIITNNIVTIEFNTPVVGRAMLIGI